MTPKPANVDCTQILSKAGLFEPAKRSSNVGLVVSVDEARSGFDLFRHVQGLVNVLGENAGRQAKLRVVCSPDHTLNITARKRKKATLDTSSRPKK